MVAEIPNLATVLKRHSYSVTKARQDIFNALSDSGPITMAQLTNKVRARVDRASVYRTIDLFEKLGIVNRLQIGWKYKLELSDIFTEHHHHATCLLCGTVVSIKENQTLENQIKAAAAQAGFNPVSHSLEIKGVCPNCAQKAAAA